MYRPYTLSANIIKKMMADIAVYLNEQFWFPNILHYPFMKDKKIKKTCKTYFGFMSLFVDVQECLCVVYSMCVDVIRRRY